MNIWIGLALIVALTAATAYFVAQEFAFVAADRGRLHRDAEAGDRGAAQALRVTGRLSFMLSGAQLGITVTALLAGYLAEPFLGQGLAALMGRAGVPHALSLSIAVALALAVATVIQMVLGEFAPKNLAITKPEPLAKALSRSTLAYLAVAGPVIRVVDAAANLVLRLVGIKPVQEMPQGTTREDLERIVADARERGELDDGTARLLASELDLRGLTAGEAMVPRVHVLTMRATQPATDLVKLLASGRSRFPVTGGGRDDIIGAVSIADVLGVAPHLRATTAVGAIARPAVFVPRSASLPRVLERLRAEHRQLAGAIAGFVHVRDALKATTHGVHATAADLVTPPYVLRPRQSVMSAIRGMREHRAQPALVAAGGAPVGLVALEDLLEQVIGEFNDETDTSHVEKGKPG